MRSSISGPVVSCRAAAIVVSLAVAIGCAPSGERSSAGDARDIATVRAEIEEVTRRWEASLLAGVPDEAVAEVFTEDAVRLPSGEPAVQGREAIARALTGSVPLQEASFTIEDLEVDGDLAFANGVYRVRADGSGELAGKFLEVWKRTRAGWRIHRVMWD